jgi:GST-like protein
VPTLELENGEVMTETAAIALMVLDRCPDLAPPVGQPERRQFQRLLIWLVANVYPTFTYADYPERWVPDAPEQLRRTVSNTENRSGCGWKTAQSCALYVWRTADVD